jgi:hypothetical protein
MKIAILAAACGATLLSAGCGGGQSSDQQAVSKTVHTYLHALGSGDGAGACATFTPALRAKAVAILHKAKPTLAHPTCAAAYTPVAKALSEVMSENGLDASDFDSVHVHVKIDGATATASVDQTDNQLKLRRVGTTWLIVRSL